MQGAAAVIALPVLAANLDTSLAKTTEAGHFRVSISSKAEPIPINRMHAWVVAVAARDGKPVTGATVDFGGGMPDHGHGLPTAPRVTKALGGGGYLIEGMKFHMSGHWQLKLAIESGHVKDEVTFNIVLE